MIAACQVAAYRGISHGSRSAATMSAGSDRDAGATNARPTPRSSTMPKIGPADVGVDAA